MESMMALAKREFEKMKRQKQREAAEKQEEPASAAAAPSRPMGEMGRDELIEYLNNMGKIVERKVDELYGSFHPRYLALRVNGRSSLLMLSDNFDAYPVPDEENLPGGGWYTWSGIIKSNTSTENSSVCIFVTNRTPRPDYRMDWGKFGKHFTKEELINDPEAKLRCYEITADDKDENGIVKQTFLLEKLVEWINESDTGDAGRGEEKIPESDSPKGGRRKKKRAKTRKKKKKKTRRGGKRTRRKKKRKTRRKRKTKRRK